MTGDPRPARPAPRPWMDPVTAKARLRQAALCAFGEKGFGVPVREIADRAGVSAGLIAFHFGSKEGLREAVEDYVFERFWEVVHVAGDDPATNEQARRSALVEAFRQNPEVVAFFRRVFSDDSERSRAFIRRLVDIELAQLSQQSRDGALRDLPDETMVAFVITAMHVGLMTMAPAVEEAFGASFFAPEVLDRWFAAQWDLLTNGLYGGSRTKGRDD